MKTIEQCLDIILQELVKNWDKPNNQRDDLKGEEILKQFELPDTMRKHEFFKRLLDRLVKDGYAELPETGKAWYSLEHYQEDTLITIEGYYFIKEQNGYSKEADQKIIEKSKQDAYDTRMETSTSDLAKWTQCLFWGTVFVGVATVALVVTEILKSH